MLGWLVDLIFCREIVLDSVTTAVTDAAFESFENNPAELCLGSENVGVAVLYWDLDGVEKDGCKLVSDGDDSAVLLCLSSVGVGFAAGYFAGFDQGFAAKTQVLASEVEAFEASERCGSESEVRYEPTVEASSLEVDDTDVVYFDD